MPAFVECEWEGPFFAGSVPGDGVVRAGVFNEIDGPIEAKGHEFDEFVEGDRFEAAVEVDAKSEVGIASGALAGLKEAEGFAPIRITFGFEGGPTFEQDAVDLRGGGVAKTPGVVAGGDGEVLEKAEASVASVAVEGGAVEGALGQGRGLAGLEKSELLFEGGVAEFGPGVDAADTAVLENERAWEGAADGGGIESGAAE